MIYMYDEIVGKMMYTTLDEDVDVAAAVELARRFRKMSMATKEYVIARMQMIIDMEKDSVSE